MIFHTHCTRRDPILDTIEDAKVTFRRTRKCREIAIFRPAYTRRSQNVEFLRFYNMKFSC